jgi:hypothetical protein
MKLLLLVFIVFALIAYSLQKKHRNDEPVESPPFLSNPYAGFSIGPKNKHKENVLLHRVNVLSRRNRKH